MKAKDKKIRLYARPYVPEADRPKATVPAVGGCCDECLKKNAVGNGHVLAVYCQHFQTGAAIRLGEDGKTIGRWTMFAPISMQAWAVKVADIVLLRKALEQVQAFTGGEDQIPAPPSHTIN